MSKVRWPVSGELGSWPGLWVPGSVVPNSPVMWVVLGLSVGLCPVAWDLVTPPDVLAETKASDQFQRSLG